MATDVVYEFFKSRFRPYNANDVAANLAGQIEKKAIQHALDKLVKKERLFVKVNAKQKVYCIVPDRKQDAHELIRIDRELQTHANELESRLSAIENQVKVKEELLSALRSAPSLEVTSKEHQEIRARLQQMERRLDNLMESTGSQNLSEKKDKTKKSFDLYSHEYSKRKRLCTDVLESILGGYPGTKKALYDDTGIEVKIVN